ncbi:MAG: hypothetical protein Ct9H300mP16_08660 [Pseudomonadota bacterium]|nr:MAG: hypothetical protein Ct9H300mP16_08660 [Pseudomonadota bacterium]
MVNRVGPGFTLRMKSSRGGVPQIPPAPIQRPVKYSVSVIFGKLSKTWITEWIPQYSRGFPHDAGRLIERSTAWLLRKTSPND